MKILMIGAHQDDNEFRCGGIAFKLRQNGHSVKFLSLTNGCGGHHLLSAEETVSVRATESALVAKLLDVDYDVWLDQDDCALMPDLATRRLLIRYIRDYAPDVIITHRANDYHADHRACALLVQDASYLLCVPHECPDVPAMKSAPVILYYEDSFTSPDFVCDFIFDIDDVIDKKLLAAFLNKSQVFEWLPYINGETVPENEAERYTWFLGMDMGRKYTDDEINALPRGYAVRFARPAARFRNELLQKYGAEKGETVRFAEAFQLCPYGAKVNDAVLALFNTL